MTKISRSLAPINLLTVQEWCRFARQTGVRNGSWRGGIRRYVHQTGGALVLKADDTMVVYAKMAGGKISQRTYKPKTWCWA